jgi:hypothetical protein
MTNVDTKVVTIMTVRAALETMQVIRSRRRDVK